MNAQIVKDAENAITKPNNRGKRELKFPGVSTSKIRKFLSAVTALNNKVEIFEAKNPDNNILPSHIESEIQYLKVRLLYQVGREWKKVKGEKINALKDFVEEAKLLQRIDDIGNSKKKFKDFYGYVEALVAYHRFYGGKTK